MTKEIMNKVRILITGGSGFIGTNIIEFYKDKYHVLNFDINKPRNKQHMDFWVKGDILNKKHLVKTFKSFQPDYVLHMAARTDLLGKSIQDYEANTEGVNNIIAAINSINSIKKTIFASSRLVCEIGYKPKNEFDYKPSTIYGESKIIGEKIIRNSSELKNQWIIVRPTSLWGPWFDIPYKNFFDTINKNLYVHPKGRRVFKKFGFIGNSVFILDKLMFNDTLNTHTLYLSDFRVLEVKQWADIISYKIHGHNVKSVPLFVLKLLALSGDILKIIGYKSPPITSFRLDNLLTTMDYNTSEVEQVVGQLPYNLEEATSITYDWYKEKK